MELKQVIIVRQDLKLSKGKTAAQASHASVDCIMKADNDVVNEWRSQGMKKVVLKVQTEKDLFKYKQLAEDAGLPNCIIRDGGRTEVAPGTITCVGIGPADEEEIDRITKDLKML